MLDTPLAFRLLTNIAPETDLLFVGDTASRPQSGLADYSTPWFNPTWCRALNL